MQSQRATGDRPSWRLSVARGRLGVLEPH